jgi:hypothetical protein
MKEFKFYLPVRGNDNIPFSKEDFFSFENDLLKSFGGFTSLGTCQGQWKNEQGKLFTDTNKIYCVSGKIENLYILLKKWNSVFRQESFYIVETGETNFFNPNN